MQKLLEYSSLVPPAAQLRVLSNCLARSVVMIESKNEPTKKRRKKKQNLTTRVQQNENMLRLARTTDKRKRKKKKIRGDLLRSRSRTTPLI
jgi:hypothetical protein